MCDMYYVSVWIYRVLRYFSSIAILTATRDQTTHLAFVQWSIPLWQILPLDLDFVQLLFHSNRVDFFNQKTSIDLLWFIPWLELYTMWTIIMYICCQFKSQNPTPYFTTNYLVFILFFQEDYIYLNSIIHIVLIPILHKMCVFILMHKIIN